MTKKSKPATTVVIQELGSKGEGKAYYNNKKLYVPFTLPGEEVEITVAGDRGEPNNIVIRSGDRKEPICDYFSECGGCVLQHLDREKYLEWKYDQLVKTLLRDGISTDIRPLRSISPGSRQRTVLSARRTRDRVLIGYHRYRGASIVPVDCCPVLLPEISDNLKEIGQIISPFLSRRNEAKITVLKTATGLDIAVSGAKSDWSSSNALSTFELSDGLKIARLTVNEEPVLLVREPIFEVKGLRIPISPGAFVQATQDSADVMIDLVLEEIGSATRIADLFCGSGTFTLPVAQFCQVRAFESDSDALKAVDKAIKMNSGLKPVNTIQRDLFADPLSSDEMNAFNMVIIDPPRAGARKQFSQIAKSDVRKVISVSCNPSTFSRDAGILIDGGYKLSYVVPVDQFLFSHHVELVAKFVKK